MMDAKTVQNSMAEDVSTGGNMEEDKTGLVRLESA